MVMSRLQLEQKGDVFVHGIGDDLDGSGALYLEQIVTATMALTLILMITTSCR
jgi:hypothetical protein